MTLTGSFYEMLARKYEAIARAQERGDNKPLHLSVLGPHGSPDPMTDDYLNRGLRDFLFPWKG